MITDKPRTRRRIDPKSGAMIGLNQARICGRLEVSLLTDLMVRDGTSLSRLVARKCTREKRTISLNCPPGPAYGISVWYSVLGFRLPRPRYSGPKVPGLVEYNFTQRPEPNALIRVSDITILQPSRVVN